MTLEVKVQKSLGNFAIDAEFSVNSQGVSALYGRSGSGKTSLVNMLAGLENPDQGSISIDGTMLFDKEKGINLPPEQRRLGYVFQEARLFPHLSIEKNLNYGKVAATHKENIVTFDQIVELLDLSNLLKRRPYSLSGGEKQRVALGRALLAAPRLLLMDEPLASLDAHRKSEILPFIERLREEVKLPIVYVSHAIEEIVRLADSLILISDGKVVASGPIEEVTSRLDLFPLTGRYEAGAVVATTVKQADNGFGLSTLAFNGGELLVPRVDLPEGEKLRLRIRARDISIATQKPENTSILNTLPGRINDIREIGESQVEVSIDVGVSLLARITKKARHDLNLAPGTEVFAMIKAIAIDRQTMGRRGLDKRK
ncbi:MAG: molybdenum ABC transporter ATP-binding protein [Rhodospirillales bacterium]|nr:molybdenum ABC transporter ATP-binding protein [Rhodospirillales bacterium]